MVVIKGDGTTDEPRTEMKNISIATPSDTPTRATAPSSVTRPGVPLAPTCCADREAAEDAGLAAASLVGVLHTMDPTVVSRLVRARELAAGVTRSFPGGDERFVSADSDSDSDDVIEADEPCQALFADRLDETAETCLRRARDETGLDLRYEMRDMPFLVRIRLVNFVRKLVRDDAADVPTKAREAAHNKQSPVWHDDTLLIPVVPGDMLLTALEDESDDKDEEHDAVAESVRRALDS